MIKEEIEMKAVLDNPSELRRKLKKIGAKRIGKYKQTNFHLDTGDKRLKKGRLVLRIRKNGNKTLITFKSGFKKGRAKIRNEWETEVKDFKTVLSIFNNLGFEVFFIFEKIREEYEYKGANIVIDRLPKLGYFCEIEASSEKKIFEIAKKLGIENLTGLGYGHYIKKGTKKLVF